MSDDKPWQAMVGGRLVGESWSLAMAQAYCMLNAPRGTEKSLKIVRHSETNETWVRQADGSWRRTDQPRPARRQRFASEAAGEIPRGWLPYKDD